MKGKFIVIDGSDGSGKATQTQLLAKKLELKGVGVKICDFPQYEEFFGKMVGRYLDGEFGDPTKLNPYLASLMYAGDRLQAKKDIQKWLEEGNIVITNRYVSSNIVHQGVKFEGEERDKFISWVKELEFEVYDVPKPDLTIVLYVPTEFAQKLVDKKEKRNYTEKKRDGHESNKDYLMKATDFYRELAEKENWLLIECVREGKLLPIDEINEMIMEKVEKFI